MKITGWGNNFNLRSNVLYPQNNSEIIEILRDKKIEKIICRGLGRSYGDNNLSSNIISLKDYTKKFKIYKKKKILNCTANISFRDVKEDLIKNGFFFNVTPGSQNVTIAGAIANDVHGKNHHKDGTFTKYVKEITLITPSGKIITCSQKKNVKLFRATCGGAGLTGIIISAKIHLIRIYSKNIDVSIIPTNNLKQTITELRKLNKNKYLIAWMDTINKKNFGRSIVISGEHSKDNNLNFKNKSSFYFPSFIGKLFLNDFFLKIFNKFYFYFSKRKLFFKQDIDNFFYPLDKIINWNKFYGKKGFVQIQMIISDKKNLFRILNKIFLFLNNHKIYSYLTTLKEFGKANKNYLSFPQNGLTITLDIPVTDKLTLIYPNFEKILIKYGVKVYLAKDSLMSKTLFKKTYKQLNNFIKIKKKIDKNKKFSSLQSERLGI